MADRTTTLAFVAKDSASRAIKGIKGSVDDLGKSSANVGPSLSGVATNLAKMGVAAGAVAIGALVAGLTMAAKAAMEEEQNIARLDAALRANIEGWDGNRDAVERVIAGREKLAFADDVLRDSLGALVVATKDIAQAEELQAVAMDLARAKNIDLATATDMLVKVQAGSYRALKSLGIELKPVTTKQDALRASTDGYTDAQMKAAKATDASATKARALGAIQEATAGQAAAYGKTAAGSFEAFNIAMNNVVEDIGSALLPMLTEFANFLTNEMVPAFREDWIPAIQDTLRWLSGLWAFMEDPGGDWKGVDRLKEVAAFIGSDIDTTSYETAVADVSAATAAMATDVVSYSEDAAVGMASSAAQLALSAGDAAAGLEEGGEASEGALSDLSAAMKTYKDRILSDARSLVSGLKATFTLRADWDVVVADFTDLLDRLAAAIKDPKEQAKYREWADGLVAELKGPMTGERRVEILRDALNLTGDMGTVLKDGFAAQDPLIREGTKDMLAGVPELLKDLETEAETFGYRTGRAYGDGIYRSRAYIEWAAQQAVIKAKAIFEASSPPGPESPLHQIDVWGERTGRAWADGLASGVRSGMAAMPAISGALAAPFQAAPDMLASSGSGRASPAIGGGSPLVIQLTVDGRELARVVDRNLYAVYRSTGS